MRRGFGLAPRELWSVHRETACPALRAGAEAVCVPSPGSQTRGKGCSCEWLAPSSHRSWGTGAPAMKEVWAATTAPGSQLRLPAPSTVGTLTCLPQAGLCCSYSHFVGQEMEVPNAQVTLLE